MLSQKQKRARSLNQFVFDVPIKIFLIRQSRIIASNARLN